ncbi:hypothetical protein AB1Y20_009943 [Prymnesium parvum]|uniref:GDP-Man:Man(3)GlcNAc(2)-PP-Dol alpha-1,2-mannosyltransferase n=1 Tax=Prymnesium parvum TaxID=97485 RepID=A0AB34K3K2_PRYPA
MLRAVAAVSRLTLHIGVLALVITCLALAALRVRLLVARTLGRRKTLAFLHPYCNDGGGGERVLWVAIRALQASGALDPSAWRVVVYTGDADTDEQIRAHARARFGVAVGASVQFVRLALRGAIEARCYPVATLLGQGLGSMLLAAEAIWRAPPDVLVDTTGLGFAFPLLRLSGVPHIAAYVHYPIISSDMVKAVSSRHVAHNNSGSIAKSAIGTALKLLYYRLLVFLYSGAGRCADLVMANGSWTAGHLSQLWGRPPEVVFPPCDTRALEELPLRPPGGRQPQIVSLAQFRPEKDHALQLRAFAMLLSRYDAFDPPRPPRPHLVLAGAVRHSADQALLDKLRNLAQSLNLTPRDVTFSPNLSLEAVFKLLGESAVGLHTMWNEHFGIGVVEMMAAGLAVVAHDSGGPAMDIIGRNRDVGLLAATESEYCEAMASLLFGSDAERFRGIMAAAARSSVRDRFSESAFSDAFCGHIRVLLPKAHAI